MKKLCLMAVWMIMISASVHAQMPLKTVMVVDLDRYAGVWYEIARYPNNFQAQCSGDVSAEYEKRADGKITVINRCKKKNGTYEQAEGVARVVENAGNAVLKVRFAPAWLSWLPMVWGDYWIIALSPDYAWAVVGEPKREYLWILSRTKTMPEDAYRMAVQHATAQGFKADRLIKTIHTDPK